MVVEEIRVRFLLFGLNPRLVRDLDVCLARTPHCCVATDEVQEAREFVEVTAIDAGLFNADHSRGIGVDLIRLLRLAGTETLLVLMHTRGDTDAVVQWLEAADDVVRGPMEAKEIAARLIALARPRNSPGEVISVGSVTLDTVKNTLEVGGQLAQITSSEVKLLHALMKRPGVVVPKAELRRAMVQGGQQLNPKVIDVMLSHIRKKLADLGVVDFVTSVWGRGLVIEKPGYVGASAAVRDSGRYVSS